MQVFGRTVSWRVLGPALNLAAVLLLISLDMGLSVGASIETHDYEVGVVFKFPWARVAGLTIVSDGNEFIIKLSLSYAVLAWSLLIMYWTHFILVIVHMKFKTISVAATLIISVIIMLVFSISLRADLYLALKNVFSTLTCDGCYQGN